MPYYTSWNFDVPATTEENNSIGHQPYVPSRQKTADSTTQFHNYPKPPQPYFQQRPETYRQPTLTAAAAADLPYQSYQPIRQKRCTGKTPLVWPQPPPQHSPSGGRNATHCVCPDLNHCQ